MGRYLVANINGKKSPWKVFAINNFSITYNHKNNFLAYIHLILKPIKLIYKSKVDDIIIKLMN